MEININRVVAVRPNKFREELQFLSGTFNALKECGGIWKFNLKYKICADFDMMYNLYNRGYKFLYKKKLRFQNMKLKMDYLKEMHCLL